MQGTPASAAAGAARSSARKKYKIEWGVLHGLRRIDTSAAFRIHGYVPLPFPQLTMGLAPLVVALKIHRTLERTMSGIDQAARFWAKIFGISFVFGVVTGIPMEFQFGTNWSHFSRFAGGVIGQTLAMEGTFAFFLESAFLGLFLFGEKRLSKIAHWWTGVAVFFGSWLSGYFIVATDAWMQHPVAYRTTADGSVTLSSFWGLLLNPWALWQYAHNMAGAAVTGAFAMAALWRLLPAQRRSMWSRARFSSGWAWSPEFSSRCW